MNLFKGWTKSGLSSFALLLVIPLVIQCITPSYDWNLNDNRLLIYTLYGIFTLIALRGTYYRGVASAEVLFLVKS